MNMIGKVYIILAAIWLSFATIAQTPQCVTQNDSEQINFWESNTAMTIGAAIIITLIVARTWSKRIHKKRDEVINKDEEK